MPKDFKIFFNFLAEWIPLKKYTFLFTGILQESNQEILTDADILAEDVYDDTVVLTKENFLSYVQQVKMKTDPFSNEFSVCNYFNDIHIYKCISIIMYS